MSESLFQECKSSTLKNVAALLKICPRVGEAFGRSDILQGIRETVEAKGARLLSQSLSRDVLKRICDLAEVDHNHNNPKSRMVLSKRVYEILSSDAHEWLTNCEDREIVKAICQTLDIDVEGKSLEIMAANAAEEIVCNGLHSVLSLFAVPLLQSIAKDLRLSGYYVNNKEKLINAIITRSHIEKVKEAVLLKRKVPIARCTTALQLHNFYSVEELREWCRQHSLSTKGRKTQIIRSILSYNPDENQETTNGSSSSTRMDDESSATEDEGTAELVSDNEEEEEDGDSINEYDDLPEDLQGQTVVMAGKLSRRRECIARDLRKVGAICRNLIEDDCTLLLVESLDIDDPKVVYARKHNIRMVTEDFVRHFYNDDV